MDSGSNDLTGTLADLQRARAFDAVSHDRLMATVAALQGARLLPAHDQRALFSADPDLHVLLAEGLSGLIVEQSSADFDANTQAHAIRARLVAAQQHV